MGEKFKPGEISRRSGHYRITPGGGERTVVKGEPFPPTPQRNQKYVLVDPTRTKPTR